MMCGNDSFPGRLFEKLVVRECLVTTVEIPFCFELGSLF
jgi:hypothetical protein